MSGLTTIHINDYIRIDDTTYMRKGHHSIGQLTDPKNKKPIWVNKRVDVGWGYIDEEGNVFKIIWKKNSRKKDKVEILTETLYAKVSQDKIDEFLAKVELYGQGIAEETLVDILYDNLTSEEMDALVIELEK